MSLDQLFQRMQEGDVKELNVILKADVQGSVEVLNETLRKLSTDKVKVNVIHASVGAISTNDVLLASASKAIVVGFNVRPERSAASWPRRKASTSACTPSSTTLIDELKAAMTGLLEPKFQEVFQGRAEVRDTFKVPKAGVIAGCMVVDGVIPRTASVRLLRDNRVIYEGKIASLRRFKNDVSEVRRASSAASASSGSRTSKSATSSKPSRSRSSNAQWPEKKCLVPSAECRVLGGGGRG